MILDIIIEPWIFFAVLAALSWAGNSLVNEYFQIRSLHLLFWMRLFVVLALIPVVLQFDPPTDPIFYLMLAGTVVCFAYADVIYFKKAADSGAGVVTRFEGLMVPIVFVFWILLDPMLMLRYLETPVRSAGILAALSGGVYFALRLRHCDFSFPVLKAMTPALLAGGMGVVFGKIAMSHSDYHSGVWYYSFLQSLSVLIVYAVVLGIPKISKRFAVEKLEDSLFSKRTIIAAACIAIGWSIHVPSKYYAITDVENPAYVSVIGLTAPFWVLLIYRLLKRREDGDIMSGIGIVFCAILLIIFTQF